MKKIIILLTLLSIFTINTCVWAEDDEATAKVISYAGEVNVYPGAAKDAVSCRSDMRFKGGDRIKTGKEAYLEIAFDQMEKNIVRVEENSDVVILLEEDNKINLINGKIYTQLNNLPKGRVFKVKTPCVVCGARGTGWVTDTNSQETTVSSYESKVFVRGLKKDGTPMEGMSWTKEGYRRKTNKFEKPGKTARIPKEELDAMKKKMGLVIKTNEGRGAKINGKRLDKKEELKDRVEERRDKTRVESIQDKKDSGSGPYP